jgi:hypothetical protein
MCSTNEMKECCKDSVNHECKTVQKSNQYLYVLFCKVCNIVHCTYAVTKEFYDITQGIKSLIYREINKEVDCCNNPQNQIPNSQSNVLVSTCRICNEQTARIKSIEASEQFLKTMGYFSIWNNTTCVVCDSKEISEIYASEAIDRSVHYFCKKCAKDYYLKVIATTEIKYQE